MFLDLTLYNQDDDDDILINSEHIKSIGIEEGITAIYMTDGETTYFVEEDYADIAGRLIG